jgi:hypothetical protein
VIAGPADDFDVAHAHAVIECCCGSGNAIGDYILAAC